MRMMALARICFAVVLALVVALGSLTHALARYQAAGAQTLVICTGYGLVRITLDAEGNPVEHTLPCPDCILSLASLAVESRTVARPDGTAGIFFPVCAGDCVHVVAPHLWPQTRAPPLIV